jgi:uncharacterized protein (DUF488 family)
MAETPIYTIGYGSRALEQLIELLKAYEIEFLIDIRSQPYSSYKPEYSKDALEERLKQDGIRYVFMGDELGGRPKDESCYVNGKVDYERLREKSFYQEGIARLHIALEKGLRVALFCSEGKPQECHRSKLVGETLAAQGVDVRHIDEAGNVKTQQEVIEGLTHGQQSMFGPPPTIATSRKKYDPR